MKVRVSTAIWNPPRGSKAGFTWLVLLLFTWRGFDVCHVGVCALGRRWGYTFTYVLFSFGCGTFLLVAWAFSSCGELASLLVEHQLCGFSSRSAGAWQLGHMGLSCSTWHGIIPDQESKLCPLHWPGVDSYPLRSPRKPRGYSFTQQTNWVCSFRKVPFSGLFYPALTGPLPGRGA